MVSQQSQSSRGPGFFRALGLLSGWLLFAMILLQFGIVVLRYVFNANFVWAGELVTTLQASTITLATGWTLLADRHVRIDVLNDRIGGGGRSAIERLGTVVLLVPLALVIFISSLGYVAESWSAFEGSAEVSGLPGLFVIKTLVPLFAGLLLMAGCVKIFAKRSTRDNTV